MKDRTASSHDLLALIKVLAWDLCALLFVAAPSVSLMIKIMLQHEHDG